MTIELLNEEFGRHAPQLKSFLLKITASLKDAEDIVHDTYLKAFDRRATFRGESTIRTWLFAIASNLAKDNFRAKTRWTEDVTDIAREAALADHDFLRESIALAAQSPNGQFDAREHISFCFSCISKSLPLEQQLSIFLKEVYEFKVAEIAAILDTTAAMVKYYLHTGRTKMIDIFDGRCALINKKGVCHQCSELNGLYNPKQNTQEELMKISLVQESDKRDKERLFRLRMKILQATESSQPQPPSLQLHHLEFNRHIMEKYMSDRRL